MSDRYAITGLGAVSSIGVGVPDFLKGLQNGRCGISPLERFDPCCKDITQSFDIKDFKL